MGVVESLAFIYETFIAPLSLQLLQSILSLDFFFLLVCPALFFKMKETVFVASLRKELRNLRLISTSMNNFYRIHLGCFCISIGSF